MHCRCKLILKPLTTCDLALGLAASGYKATDDHMDLSENSNEENNDQNQEYSSQDQDNIVQAASRCFAFTTFTTFSFSFTAFFGKAGEGQAMGDEMVSSS